MLLMIDNYDSFTYNLVQYLGELGERVTVYRNDQISLNDVDALAPSHVVISPGPCTPNEAGISVDLVREYGTRIPILGVCLGHQSIAQAYGATIVRAPTLMHGKTSMIEHDGMSIFNELPTPFQATRYHSLVVEESSLPDCFTVTARADDGQIMGIAHHEDPVVGVQFHPESILTQYGHKMLDNFLRQSPSQ
ncbi:MAG: anthranilate/aminodeoxychorismate synthase component II [Acidiferrobacteraceae bacterium]|jgi:anthranilate synthase/aminodeoxychorismate synthase-like glutamine amidotransferase|nr:anthranilate/aminodeoxychorismate synthase component II [Acidiferrobacteraceae bacterium]MCP4829395.1 aminodeoxychorismate/anthranilate synthase component II [Pseudomonadota bacterium]HJP07412.1 aminodeoxychorismate/anthranilate synthase component II [Arenicellales bacterium]|tara:strand:- start:11845 stop:12420 length:576 start_codon:yes stop_codon:yes gene_type:complete